MSASLKAWIASAFVSELNSVLEQAKNRQLSGKDSVLSINLTKPKAVQLIPGDGSRNRISDGTTYVVVVFDGTMVERYEQNSSRHFSDLDGGVIGLKNYDLTSPVSLRIFVRDFKALGSEGSATFFNPEPVEQLPRVTEILEQLVHPLPRSKGVRDLALSSPVESREIPPPNQSHGSSFRRTVQPDQSIEIQTQVDDSIQHPAEKFNVFKGPRALLSALLKSNKAGASSRPASPPKSVINRPDTALKQVPDARAKEMKAALDTRANTQQSQYETQIYTSQSLDRAAKTKPKTLNSGDAPVSLCDESEKENSQESVHKAHKREAVSKLPEPTEEISPAAPDPAPQFVDIFQNANPFEGLKRIPRKWVQIPKNQREILDRDDTWYQLKTDGTKTYANLPANVQEALYEHDRNSQSFPAQENKRVESGTSDEEEGSEVEEKDRKEADLDEEDAKEISDWSDSQREEAVDDDDDDSEDEAEQGEDNDSGTSRGSSPQLPIRKSSTPARTSLPLGRNKDSMEPPSSPSQHCTPSPGRSSRLAQNQSLSNSMLSPDSIQHNGVASVFKQTRVARPIFRPQDFPSSPSEGEELDVAPLFREDDVLEKDEEQMDVLETSQELPCSASPIKQVERTPLIAIGKMKRENVEFEHLHSDTVIPATFDNSKMASSMSSSVLRELFATQSSSPERSTRAASAAPKEVLEPVDQKCPLSTPIDMNSSTFSSTHEGRSPVVQIPATGRKAEQATSSTVSPILSTSAKIGPKAEEPTFSQMKANDMTKINRRKFLAKMKLKGALDHGMSVLSATPVSDIDNPQGDVTDGDVRITSTYSDLNLGNAGASPEGISIASPVFEDLTHTNIETIDEMEVQLSISDTIASSDKTTASQASAEAPPREMDEAPMIGSTSQRSAPESPERLSKEALSSANQLLEDEPEMDRDHSEPLLVDASAPGSQNVPQPPQDDSDMMDHATSVPGWSDASMSIKMPPYDEFLATYPDYKGSKIDYTRALVYLEWLNKERKSTLTHCDDFIRVLADEYKKHVADYKKHLKSGDPQMRKSILLQEPLSGYEFYQRQTSQPRYVYDTIFPHRLQALLEEMDSQTVKETRSKFWPEDESLKHMSSKITVVHPMITNETIALEDPREKSATPTESVTTAASENGRTAFPTTKKRFFETASQQVAQGLGETGTPTRAFGTGNDLGDRGLRKDGTAKARTPSTNASVHGTVSSQKSRSRKSLPWLTPTGKSPDVATLRSTKHLKTKQVPRVSSKGSVTPEKELSGAHENQGSPILGSLRESSPESRNSKRKRDIETSTTDQLDDPFVGRLPISNAARRVTMPSRSFEELSTRPRELKRQRTSASSPAYDCRSTSSKSAKAARRTTMPARGLDVSSVETWRRDSAKTPFEIIVERMRENGYVPQSAGASKTRMKPPGNATSPPPSVEPQTQGWNV